MLLHDHLKITFSKLLLVLEYNIVENGFRDGGQNHTGRKALMSFVEKG